jgi:hypothetical protein
MENNVIKTQEEYELRQKARKTILLSMIIMIIGLAVGFYMAQAK